jgi:TATA-box binding protein (TBP) (component of TFIID and TFIIIB)
MARITNVVAIAQLNCQLDLWKIKETWPDESKYEPRIFSGLLLRTLVPVKGHCQLYRNGHITVNGGKSVAQATELCQVFAERLRSLKFDALVTDFTVVNIIGTCNFGRRLNLPDIYRRGVCVYEPELFSGLSVRLSDCTAVLFHTGKCNFLGCKSEADLFAGYVEVTLLLE